MRKASPSHEAGSGVLFSLTNLELRLLLNRKPPSPAILISTHQDYTPSVLNFNAPSSVAHSLPPMRPLLISISNGATHHGGEHHGREHHTGAHGEAVFQDKNKSCVCLLPDNLQDSAQFVPAFAGQSRCCNRLSAIKSIIF